MFNSFVERLSNVVRTPIVALAESVKPSNVSKIEETNVFTKGNVNIEPSSQDEHFLNNESQQWPPKSSIPYDPEQVCIFPSQFKRGQVLHLKGSANIPVTLVDQHGEWWSVKFEDETRCTYHENEFTSAEKKKNQNLKFSNLDSKQILLMQQEIKILKQELGLKKIQRFESISTTCNEIFSSIDIEKNYFFSKNDLPSFFTFLPECSPILGENQGQSVMVTSSIQFCENNGATTKVFSTHEDIDAWYGEILHSVLNA